MFVEGICISQGSLDTEPIGSAIHACVFTYVYKFIYFMYI